MKRKGLLMLGVLLLIIILLGARFIYARYFEVVPDRDGMENLEPEDNPTNGGEQTESQSEDAIDICLGFFGKLVEDAEIPDGWLSPTVHGYNIKGEASLFGYNAHCTGSTIRRDEEIFYASITCELLTYDRALEKMIERFGNPVETGEEPYVESDGGALTWALFEQDGIYIRLSEASKYNYISVQFSQMEE